MTLHELKKFPTNIVEYPQEISETLIKIITQFNDISEVEQAAIQNELEDAIYYLRTCAENSYNMDYFRVLYATLAKITENYAK